jgi:hypothetical protein
MLKPGDSIEDRSAFNLVEEGPDGSAILSDQWGVFYVTNENSEVQYVGDNELRAEIEFVLSQLDLGEDYQYLVD